MKTNYLIFGGSGYFGSYFISHLLSDNNNNIISTYTSHKSNYDNIENLHLDLSNKDSINVFLKRISSYKNLKVIYLSALHRPDQVDKNPKKAKLINVDSFKYLIENMKNIESLFYISTDNVYGKAESRKFFKEDDPLNPTTLYGKHKCEAEKIALSAGYNVIRYPFLIGPSLSYKPHFYEEIVNSIKNNIEFKLLEDSYRSSIDFNQAASLGLKLMNECSSKGFDIVNICCDEPLSKYKIGLMIADKLNLDSDLIVPIKFNEFIEFSKHRTKDILLSNKKFKKSLNIDKLVLKL